MNSFSYLGYNIELKNIFKYIQVIIHFKSLHYRITKVKFKLRSPKPKVLSCIFLHQTCTYYYWCMHNAVEYVWDHFTSLSAGVCVLALCAFASQTQFRNSSASLHYSYKSEPADRITLRQYSWYIKVPSATITGDTITLMRTHTHTQIQFIHSYLDTHALTLWRGLKLR